MQVHVTGVVRCREHLRPAPWFRGIGGRENNGGLGRD